MPSPSGLTAKRLRELLDYDPKTGVFVWKVSRTGPGGKVGRRAGWQRHDGLGTDWRIGVEGKYYGAHVLAYLWMTGSWPGKTFDIDHINRDPGDNRWCNLRLATRSQNKANSSGHKGKKLPKGVFQRSKKYMAKICVNYKSIYLGVFPSVVEAKTAYTIAAKKHFGEFARSE